MQSFSSLALAGMLAIAAAYVGLGRATEADPGVDPMKTAAVSNAQVYRVSEPGKPSGCTLTVRNGIAGERREVTAGSACLTRLPAVAAAGRWTEDARGTVTLENAKGATIASFAPGDGVAFESIGRSSRLLTLTAVE